MGQTSSSILRDPVKETTPWKPLVKETIGSIQPITPGSTDVDNIGGGGGQSPLSYPGTEVTSVGQGATTANSVAYQGTGDNFTCSTAHGQSCECEFHHINPCQG